NGRITRIDGDREHPVSKGYTCSKGRHAWEEIYNPHRFKKPLLRTASGWQEIAWDEAIDIAADRLGEVKRKFGPLSFCATKATQNPKGISLSLFLRSLGSPNGMSSRDLCKGTQEMADMVTTGYIISTHRGVQDFRNSKCILLVGTNMAESSGGHWQDVMHAKKNGAKLIVVDPRRCESAKRADIWLQIRPGTDGALALGMLNVIINENLYDADFVANYCLGFEKLREHVQQYTPDKVAEITSLTAEEIVQVARTFATNMPATYISDSGLTLHSNSTQAARAFSILTAITGNIDVPGSNLIAGGSPPGLGSASKFVKNARLPREVEEQQLGAQRVPLWSGYESLRGFAHNPSVINAIITGEPYPVKSMIVYDPNIAVSFPDTRKVIEALEKLEFLLVLAFTPSPTSEFAHLILPTIHDFEQNSISFRPYGENCLSAMPKLVEPPEGCLDFNILYRLSERMVQKGYIEKNLVPWQNMDEFVEWQLSKTGYTFADLCNKGPIVFERQYRKYVKDGFKTPSGKVELYSSILERHGYDPLPTFREFAESPLVMRKLAEEYPLILTTRRSQNYWSTRTSAEGWLRKLTPYPKLQIHPAAAEERGIQAGDMVVVETPRGTFQHVAEITEDVSPQLVSGQFGWWLPERESPEKGCLEANVNAVMSYDPPYDPVVGINSVQGVMCQVRL
ncbi:molybdopterin-dependent oxidoreductase, partial [Chloroflexota bacterium]